MDVAHVDEVLVGPVFRTGISLDDEDVIVGRECHGDGVVQLRWGVIGAPVHGIDANAGGSDDGIHIFHVLHGVVADGNTRIGFTLGWTDMRAGEGIFGADFVAQDVGGCQLSVGLVIDVLQQFHHSHTSLAETCEDERTALVPLLLEVVEGFANIVHRETCATKDGVFVHRYKSVDGRMSVERCIETIAA